MLLNMFKQDFIKNKRITIVLFIFISLSAFLVASGSNMIAELSNAIHTLFTKSHAPHFVQMHAGKIDQEQIDTFSDRNSLVKQQQIVEMVNVDGSGIYLNNRPLTEKNSIMDHYFVIQNDAFDFLLNMESQVIQIAEGEIAVPIYYKQQKNIQIGDSLRISIQGLERTFKIVDFVRDVQMNPSIIHSKRFVINEMDLDFLKQKHDEIEYLIEFRLKDLSKLNAFKYAYESANMPGKGPTVDYQLFKTLNALTDGIVAAVLIVISLLLSIISMLCIRFIILAAIEEDYQEIGVLKAIGIGLADIKKLYLFKYMLLAAFASATGYIASFIFKGIFTANMTLYIGKAPKSIWLQLIPLLAALLVFLFVVVFCLFMLRKFNKISAVEALRSGSLGVAQNSKHYAPLYKNRFLPVSLFLGFRDVFSRFKMYVLLFFVFLITAFMIIVPVNLLNTAQSPDFIRYMGVEKSDIRIDLQQMADEETFNKMITYLEKDPDVKRFAPFVTSQFKAVNPDGVQENITVETGDFSTFPLEYLKGTAPGQDHEIALSYLNAKALEKNVGDMLRLIVDGQEKALIVSGIYQDVTNGGLTAKALIPFNSETVLWHEISLDVKSGVNISEKVKTYAMHFPSVKVTDLKGYLAQTFQNQIDQLRLFTIFAIVIALFVAILITSLFIRMLIAKDATQIAIMKSIGFSINKVRAQYVTSVLTVLGIGILSGKLIANTLGERLVSTMLSFMGAADIEFVINPIQAYVLCPFVLCSVVAMTTLVSMVSIKKSTIAEQRS